MNKYLTLLTKKSVREWVVISIKAFCVIACLLYILNIFFFDSYSLRTYKHLKKELDKKTVSNSKIAATNTDLEAEINRLKNDAFYIETIARKDYKMVKKGETVYIFSR